MDGNIGIMEALLNTGIDANVPTEQAPNCLVAATYKAQLPKIEFLLDKGTDKLCHALQVAVTLSPIRKDFGGIEAVD